MASSNRDSRSDSRHIHNPNFRPPTPLIVVVDNAMLHSCTAGSTTLDLLALSAMVADVVIGLSPGGMLFVV